MSGTGSGAHRHEVGDTVEDHCRFCQALRSHAVSIADGDGRIVRAVSGSRLSRLQTDLLEAFSGDTRCSIPPGQNTNLGLS